MRSDSKRQAHIHTAAITFDWRIQEFLELRKSDNLIKLLFGFASGHSENRTIQENIFTPSQFWVEACAHLEQACHASLDPYPSLRGLCNPTQNFQERGFSSSVSTNNADHLALVYLECHFFQVP